MKLSLSWLSLVFCSSLFAEAATAQVAERVDVRQVGRGAQFAVPIDQAALDGFKKNLASLECSDAVGSFKIRAATEEDTWLKRITVDGGAFALVEPHDALSVDFEIRSAEHFDGEDHTTYFVDVSVHTVSETGSLRLGDNSSLTTDWQTLVCQETAAD